MIQNYDSIIKQIKEITHLQQGVIEEKINKKLEEFKGLVSKEGAAHMIANELKVKLFTSPTPKTLKIREIRPKMSAINTTAKVLNIYDIRSYRTEKREGRVGSLFVGDDTSFMRITIWDETLLEQIPKLKEGDIIDIKNAYSRLNNNFTELHLGSKSQLIINPEGITINVREKQQETKKQIKDVQPNDFTTILATIVQIFEPKYYQACPECNRKVLNNNCQTHGPVTPKETPIINLFIDDGTATLRAVCFRDQAEQIIGPVKDFESIKKHALLKQLKFKGKIIKNEMFNRLEMLTSNIEEPSPETLIQELNTQ